MATGYDGQGNEESAFDLGWIGPAGSMYSTLNDLMKVCTYVYGNNCNTYISILIQYTVYYIHTTNTY